MLRDALDHAPSWRNPVIGEEKRLTNSKQTAAAGLFFYRKPQEHQSIGR